MRSSIREELKRLWNEGTIGTPEGPAHYWVKAYETGSEYGIDEGRISKLEITINGQTVAGYDRGWWKKLDENNESAVIAYRILLKEYN